MVLDLTDGRISFGIIGVILLTGILAGSYPAFLASFPLARNADKSVFLPEKPKLSQKPAPRYK